MIMKTKWHSLIFLVASIAGFMAIMELFWLFIFNVATIEHYFLSLLGVLAGALYWGTMTVPPHVVKHRLGWFLRFLIYWAIALGAVVLLVGIQHIRLTNISDLLTIAFIALYFALIAFGVAYLREDRARKVYGA